MSGVIRQSADELALWAAIRHDPADDAPRMALADLLLDDPDSHRRAEGEFLAASLGYAADRKPETLGRMNRTWDACRISREVSAVGMEYNWLMDSPEESLPPGMTFGFWRGMVHTWMVDSVARFEILAKGVFETFPVERVRLSCPVGSDGLILMRSKFTDPADRAYPDDVSNWELWRLLRPRRKDRRQAEYRKPEAAKIDLERAMRDWGRSLWDLPVLETTTKGTGR